jgi:hypothetical protein
VRGTACCVRTAALPWCGLTAPSLAKVWKTRDVWFYEHRVPERPKACTMTKPIGLEHLKRCADWWGGPDRKGRIETEFAWRVSAETLEERDYKAILAEVLQR